MNFRMLIFVIVVVLLPAGAVYSQGELKENGNYIEKFNSMLVEEPSQGTAPEEEPLARTDDLGHERARYDRALDYYFAEEADMARNEFNIFIDNYPDSRLIPNAWYWLAETYYMEDEFPRAILIFRQVLKQFPDDPKAPDALLKIGYSYARLNDLPNSLFHLEILIEDHPGSPAAEKASAKILELISKQ